jgi:hypothetical protein
MIYANVSSVLIIVKSSILQVDVEDMQSTLASGPISTLVNEISDELRSRIEGNTLLQIDGLTDVVRSLRHDI